ncbi:Metallo-dependent phosphatase-like protein [Halteromyces radiatus]|uniref:Metallo-dependent phosphatase-like protein n=1 Tax=Halteromyces radiatus TaxID=101107 RepID=UPI002220B8D3|nr:Metallo-dependent phosphatase-like protein [Halteromyces radiatus]KAI8086710.1 Metallo-dependent phosphatase-like protein [Halteromyces radiatus]
MVTTWRWIWILILLIGEWLVFRLAVTRCPWPAPSTSLDSNAPERVLLIADPQVTDAYSYDRQGVLLWLTEFYSDLYMQRSYQHVTRQRQPDKIVILGDLMDGGREWDDQGFKTQLGRFYKIFNQQTKTLYMSGNHDIGIRDGIQPHIYERFQQEFGPSSSIHSLAYNHTLVIIDTVTLTNTQPSIRQDALAILDQIAHTNKIGQRVLMTHVPLYRPEQTSCGPLRVQSRPFIYQGYGHQYQNLMEHDISQAILEQVQPELVFSGDDHDFCKVTHKYKKDDLLALEYTVPTFSMSQGVRQPGYMLLQATEQSLVPQLCWLPDQLGIFIMYGFLAGVTMILSFISHIYSLIVKRRMKRMKKNDEEQVLDVDSTMTTTSLLYGTVLLTLSDIKEVALVAFPFYLFCILLL